MQKSKGTRFEETYCAKQVIGNIQGTTPRGKGEYIIAPKETPLMRVSILDQRLVSGTQYQLVTRTLIISRTNNPTASITP